MTLLQVLFAQARALAAAPVPSPPAPTPPAPSPPAPTPPAPAPIPDGGWKKLPQFLDRIAAMPGLGASAADTTYTGIGTAVDIYIDSIDGNDGWDGTKPFYVSGTVGPKKTLFPVAPARNTFSTAKKYGILAGSNVTGNSPGGIYRFGAYSNSQCPGPTLISANGISFVGIARTSAAAITTGPARSRRNARVAGQELKPLRSQFDIGRLGQWIDESDKNEWFWFAYADGPTSTNMSGTQGACFNVGGRTGFILRNCWADGFRGGQVQCDVGFVIEDCYADNCYHVTTGGGSIPEGWWIKSNAQGQPGLRIVGCWTGGNIAEDLIWNQAGSASTDSGYYDFQIKDCCLRHWCVAQTLGDSQQHSDWWQGGGHPGNYLIQRVIGEHVIRESVFDGNVMPQGQGFLTNNTGNVARPGGTQRDFIMYSNGVVINENHVGNSDTSPLVRDHVAYAQSHNPGFDGKKVTAVNVNVARTCLDTACKVWFDGKKTTGSFIDVDATPAELSSRTAGQWSTN